MKERVEGRDQEEKRVKETAMRVTKRDRQRNERQIVGDAEPETEDEAIVTVEKTERKKQKERDRWRGTKKTH